MKKIILSVAAATMAFSTSAMAIDNVKASGLAKAIYQTTENSANTNDFGDRAASQAQASVHVALTADLSKSLSAGVEVAGVTTLGLENGLVANTMSTFTVLNQSYGGTNAFRTDDQFWMSQAYITYKVGNTTVKAGLQELNTPMVFTEKWNVAKNTFQAITAINTDIKDVTLVGAYVGKHNGATDQGTVNYDGEFATFGAKGAYAVGAITKVAGVNVQGWYYNVNTLADAYWLEADTKISGIFVGAQYAGMNPNAAGEDDTNAFAVKAGGDVAGVHLYGAYSSVSAGTTGTATTADFANVSTGDKTKLYTGTASIYGDGGRAATQDTTGIKVGAKGKIAGIAVGGAYSNYDNDANGVAALAKEDTVLDFFAATKVGPVAVKAIYTDWETETTATGATADRQTIRVIASAKF